MLSQTLVGLMFSLQPGTTAAPPSVPSQKRELAPVIIRPTHIAPDQGSTHTAAESSGLSEGRASWMWWQSRDGQWEELLDAVRA
jgi:hypothetical protein